MASAQPMKASRSVAVSWLSVLLVCVPLGVLAGSCVIAPYLTNVSELHTADLPTAPNEPLLLYRNQHTRFYYTSSDLLRPEAFGKPGQYISAIAYDVWPMTDAPATLGQGLTWYLRIWQALRGTGDQQSADLAAAESFRHAFGRDLRVDRGGTKIFAIPPGTGYGRRTGISHFAALGIRIPEEGASARSATPQQFPQAIGGAFDALARAGVRGVGVPGMVVRRTLGERAAREYSWSIIMREVDRLATRSGITAVLYGGWGMAQREANDTAFRTAWAEHRTEIAKRTGELVHEQIRLVALLIFATLLVWHLRGTEFTWKRVLALVALAGGFTFGIAQAGAWIEKSLGAGPMAISGLEAVAALAIGAMIESIIRFDPKKILAGREE